MTTQAKQVKAQRPALSTGRRPRKPFAFFGETWAEFKKVVWPTRKEATRLTSIVMAITIALGIILGAIDLGFTRLIQFIGGD